LGKKGGKRIVSAVFKGGLECLPEDEGTNKVVRRRRWRINVEEQEKEAACYSGGGGGNCKGEGRERFR